MYIFAQLHYHKQDVTQSIFKQSMVGVNSKFSYLTGCLIKTNEPSLLFYLSIDEERTDVFMTFPMALLQSEMRTAWSRIWTQLSNLISYDNSYYIKPTSTWCKMYGYHNSLNRYAVFISDLVYHFNEMDEFGSY